MVWKNLNSDENNFEPNFTYSTEHQITSSPFTWCWRAKTKKSTLCIRRKSSHTLVKEKPKKSIIHHRTNKFCKFETSITERKKKHKSSILLEKISTMLSNSIGTLCAFAWFRNGSRNLSKSRQCYIVKIYIKIYKYVNDKYLYKLCL